MTIDTVDIATIYLDDNESSHFRPLADSIRIYARLLRFSLSSLAAFAVDTVALLLLVAVTGSLLLSVVGARTISSSVNFLTNRRLVFEHGRQRPVGRAAALYFGLVAVLLALNYLLLVALSVDRHRVAGGEDPDRDHAVRDQLPRPSGSGCSGLRSASSPTPPAAPPSHGGLIGHTGPALSERTACRLHHRAQVNAPRSVHRAATEDRRSGLILGKTGVPVRSTRALGAVLAAALVVTGCSATAATTAAGTTAAGSSSTSDASSTATTTPTFSTTDTTTVQTESGAAIVVPASLSDATHFDADDLTWDAADEVVVTLADDASTAADGVTVDGNTVTITAAGTYRLSGSLSDGQLVIDAGDDVVRVILDGVQLTSSTGSPLVVNSADEVLLYLADGSTNSVSDAAAYADTGDEAPNAAIYSMADLTIAGSGSLTVSGNYQDGIVSKDGLVLAGGTVTVTAVDDGIRGKDYVALVDGSYAVDAGGDGVKSDNEEDADRGWLLVSGGTLTVASGDDGVKAFNTLSVTGGTVTVTGSVEAFEAQHIDISGGTVDLTSSDDGINAAGGSSADTGGQGGGEAARRLLPGHQRWRHHGERGRRRAGLQRHRHHQRRHRRGERPDPGQQRRAGRQRRVPPSPAAPSRPRAVPAWPWRRVPARPSRAFR